MEEGDKMANPESLKLEAAVRGPTGGAVSIRGLAREGESNDTSPDGR